MYQFKLFITLVAWILLALSNDISAKVSMSVDRTDIAAGETFVLDIQMDSNTDAQPDLSLIPKEFTIVSNSQYHHSQFINGQQSTLKGWKLKLKTLEKGSVVIPGITIGNEKTSPITLTIKDSSNQLDMNGQSKLIFLETDVVNKDAYVQQQIIFMVSLYRAVNTHYASLSDPSANNSIIEKLGDDVQFEKFINNRRYIVTQRKYAIFPQESGELTITPVNFTADVNDNNRRNRNSFLSSTRPISLSTEEITIQVKPKPENAPVNWLPASNVVLVDKWAPDSQALKVGEPATWTLLLSVQGLSESQLPELSVPTVDGLQWYYDSPQKERHINENGIMGQRVEKLAVIPSKAGQLTIPEIKLDWWDVESDTLKTAILPAKTLTVQPADKQTQTPQIPVPEPVLSQTVMNQTRGVSPLWQYASFGLLLVWLLTLLAYARKPQQVNSAKHTSNTSNEAQSATAKQVLKQLKSAIGQNNSADIERLLLQWLGACGFTQIHSLNALTKHLKNETIIEKINALDAHRYSASQHEVLTSLIKSDIEIILEELSNPRETKRRDAIPPLYSR